eukprot:Nk52_evm3s335 gene=Nk52_evmTU3s335
MDGESSVHLATKNRVLKLKAVLEQAFERRDEPKVFKILDALKVIDVDRDLLRETDIAVFLREMRKVEAFNARTKDVLKKWKAQVVAQSAMEEEEKKRDQEPVRGNLRLKLPPRDPLSPARGGRVTSASSPATRSPGSPGLSFISQKRKMMAFEGYADDDSDPTAKRKRGNVSVDGRPGDVPMGLKAKKQTCVYKDGIVPSLSCLTMNFLCSNTDKLDHVGDVPPDLLLPVLESCDAQTLTKLETKNPNIIRVTGKLWKVLCKKKYPSCQRNAELLEKWRDTYARCEKEDSHRLEKAREKLKMNYTKRNEQKQQRSVGVIGRAPPQTASTNSYNSSTREMSVRQKLAASVRPVTTLKIVKSRNARSVTPVRTTGASSGKGKIMSKVMKQMKSSRR